MQATWDGFDDFVIARSYDESNDFIAFTDFFFFFFLSLLLLSERPYNLGIKDEGHSLDKNEDYARCIQQII